MNKLTRIGLDTAKNTFHLVGVDQHQKEVLKKQLSRNQLQRYFSRLSPCTIALEACGGSHHWGRELEKLGHTVIVIPAHHAKASRSGQKNDYNDARGTLAASFRSDVHGVALKSVADQDLQALIRLRSQAVKGRSSLARSVRGLLAERGIVLPRGLNKLREAIPGLLEDGDNDLTPGFRRLLNQEYHRLRQWDESVCTYDRWVTEAVQSDAGCRRLLTIPGFGPVVALQYRAKIGEGRDFRRGRDAGVSVGLTPRHYGTGGKNKTGSITKHGDTSLRCALAHGARAVVSRAHGKTDPVSQWIQQLEARVGRNKATIAYANKMARVGWAVLRHHTPFDPRLLCAPRSQSITPTV